MANKPDEKNKQGPKSVTTSKNKDEVVGFVADAETSEYINSMREKIQGMRDQRKRTLPIFDGKNYNDYYKDNESIANTMIKPGRVSTGTVETKVHAMVSELATKNYLPDVEAYDESDQEDREIASVYEDAIVYSYKQEPGDGAQDREKKVMRWAELLIQGTVVLQDSWKVYHALKKKPVREDKGKKYKDAYDSLLETTKKMYEGPELDMINGLSFYAGNILERVMQKQPRVCSVEIMDYTKAASMYGTFENFKKHISAKNSNNANVTGSTDANEKTLTEAIIHQDIKDHQVEVIKYESNQYHENHFQILINGVPMLPIDYPLSEVTENGEYSYTSQTLGYSKYFYGKSFVSSGSVKQLARVSDLLLELMIKKTKKSIDPPFANTGRKRISKRALEPGILSMLPNAEDLVRLDDAAQGPTGAEFNMFETVQNLINQNTVSNIFQGQEANQQMTATQVEETRKRAQKALVLIEHSVISLEIKLAYRRLAILNKYWFKPVGKAPVTKNGKRVVGSQYRNMIRQIEIEGRGTGRRKTYMIDGDMPSQEEVDKLTSLEEKVSGKPTEVVVANPTEFDEVRMRFHINVYSKPEAGDTYQRAELRDTLNDAIAFGNMGIPVSQEWLKEQYANSYDAPMDKVFGQPPQAPEQLGGNPEDPSQQPGRIPGISNTGGVPNSLNIK